MKRHYGGLNRILGGSVENDVILGLNSEIIKPIYFAFIINTQ